MKVCAWVDPGLWKGDVGTVTCAAGVAVPSAVPHIHTQQDTTGTAAGDCFKSLKLVKIIPLVSFPLGAQLHIPSPLLPFSHPPWPLLLFPAPKLLLPLCIWAACGAKLTATAAGRFPFYIPVSGLAGNIQGTGQGGFIVCLYSYVFH